MRLGHRVIVTGRTQEGTEAAVARLAAAGRVGHSDVQGYVCEISELRDVQNLWNFAVQKLGRIDIWLNNAGYARTGVSFLETAPAQIEMMLRGNLIGSINSAQVAISGMQKQGGGKLYFTLGGGGGTGRVVPGMTVYSTTKRAVKYLADSLAKERREARDQSILIGTISPGINVTEGLIREIKMLLPDVRASALKNLNFIGDHVSTTTPWIVEQILGNKKQGHTISWLTPGRLLRRALAKIFGQKRDILSNYNFEV